MGYSTDFYGTLTFNKEVTEELKNYINAFSKIRHMNRNIHKIKELYPDWETKCYKGNLGLNGQYFIGGEGFKGQSKDDSVLDYNYPPYGQPGLWCDWIINDDNELEWDGVEKFYYYEEWLEYLINHFFEPEGYILNGEIDFYGEDPSDFGKIIVTDNVVEIKHGIHAMDLSEIDVSDLLEEIKHRGFTCVYNC